MSGADDGAAAPCIGVVIVAYAAETFIAQCLESLAATGWPNLRVIVVDNASPDDTAGAVRRWAEGATPFAAPADWPLATRAATPKPRPFIDLGVPDAAPGLLQDAEIALLRASENLGFAGGVNAGLRALRAQDEVDYVWVLNPDSVVEPQTPAAFVAEARRMGRFGMLGGRVKFYEAPTRIQADGGRYRRWMGYSVSVNLGGDVATTPLPDPESLDYIPGVSMFVSRAFLERAGLMDEAWFLYYEELDWAFRRGDLPLGLAPDAQVLHRAGASIGTGSGGKPTSPLSTYFMHRNLPRFALRWTPLTLPAVYLAALAVICRNYLLRHRGAWPQFFAAMRGLHQAPPPAGVRERLAASVWTRIGWSRD